jgi:ketosteroid isomerase-like protein
VERAAATVGRAWEAYIAGDIDALLTVLSPDVEFVLTHFEGWPEDDVYHGHAGVRRFLGDWLAGWERYEAGVDEITEATAARVLTLSWQRGYGAGSHVPVEMRLAHVTTVRDGAIARHELWSDREAARAAAFAD